MLSKEEIEDIKDSLRLLHKILLNEHREGTYTIQRTLEYIKQLETNNKKLIEYIEKKMCEYDETIIELVLQNILAVAKGEKE